MKDPLLFHFLFFFPCSSNFPSGTLPWHGLNQVSRHADVLGSGGISPLILKFGTSWCPGRFNRRWNISRYPSDRSLGGARTCLDAVARREKSHHCPCGEPNPGRPVHSPVTILTELPLLLPGYLRLTQDEQ